MDFSLTSEQQIIRDSVRRYINDEYGFTQRQALIAEGFSHERWVMYADMGWLAAGVPESLGGFGGPVELALIQKEFGRGLVADPFLGAAVLGPQLLIASKDAEAIGSLLPDLLSGERILAAAFSERVANGATTEIGTTLESGRLSGEKTLVLGGTLADALIVSCRQGGQLSLCLVEVDQPGVTVVPTPLLDGSDAATIRFDQAEAHRLQTPDATVALHRMEKQGIAAIVAEACGVIAGAIEMTAQYVAVRKQFGAVIGSFQAIQHQLADMAVEQEMTEACLLMALSAFKADDPGERVRRLSGAKAAAGEAMRVVCGAAVQLHGGMGMTNECGVGEYLKRAIVLDAVLGNPETQIDRFASAGFP